MKQFIVTLSLLLCCFAPAGATGEQLPNGINKIEIVVPNFPTEAAVIANPVAAKAVFANAGVANALLEALKA